MRRLRDLFRPADRLRYLLWRAASRGEALEVGLADGRRLAMRPPPAKDLMTAYELLLAGAYDPPAELPDPRPVRTLVDVGANVGYSLVLFAAQFPEAQILAFEPHPAHLELVYRHVVANGLTDRVLVVGAAAAARDGLAYLTDREYESAVVAGPGPGRLPIRLRDFFGEVEALGPRTIDLLKVDIEGGEYELIDDPRFERLDIRTIVLEWHNTPDRPDGKSWCRDRLAGLGFELAAGALDYGTSGVLWGWRAAPEPAAPASAHAARGGPG